MVEMKTFLLLFTEFISPLYFTKRGQKHLEMMREQIIDDLVKAGISEKEAKECLSIIESSLMKEIFRLDKSEKEM